MTIAAVVLDMDGLMLDTEPIYKIAWQRAAAELGYEMDDTAYAPYLGRSTVVCERELAAKLGPTFAIDRFRARWPEIWRQLAENGITPMPGLHDFLALIEGRGLRFAVATSSDQEYTRFTLERGGLGERFRVIVTGDQVAHGKPAPDIYLEAARRLGCDPGRCVALEDSDAGALAASRAGMRVFMIPDLTPPSPEAAAAAFRVLRSLDEARELLASLLDDHH